MIKENLYRIAVCDDDTDMLQNIKRIILEEETDMSIKFSIDLYDNGAQMMESAANDKRYDVVFMDVFLDDSNGYEVSKKINEYYKPLLVFVTGDMEVVYNSFQYSPFDFIRKDMLKSKLRDVLKRIEEELAKEQAIEVEMSGSHIFIEQEDIIYMQHEGRYTNIVTVSGEYKTERSLVDIEERLLMHRFVRIHRRNIVNLKYIMNVDMIKDEVALNNGKRLEMSRYAKKNVLDSFRVYNRR